MGVYGFKAVRSSDKKTPDEPAPKDFSNSKSNVVQASSEFKFLESANFSRKLDLIIRSLPVYENKNRIKKIEYG